MKKMDPKYLIKLTVTLLATCMVVAGLLGVVNMVTKDKIATINLEKTQAAMRAVVADPEISQFSDPLEITPEMEAAAASAGGSITEFYEVNDGTVALGHAMKIVSSGSQGSIQMMVGVDLEGVVTGVAVVKHAETAGIGTKIVDNEPTAAGVGVLDQFIGKGPADGTLNVGSNVDAITGATVTTKGITAGVNTAIAVINSLLG